MLHLKRLSWLAAWGLWAYLGVGLHRELPRTLGPSLCHIPSQDGETPLGFLHDSESLAFIGSSTARVVNAYTGAGEFETTAAWLSNDPYYTSLRHAVVYGHPKVGKRERDPRGGGFLDLRTGRWTMLDFYVGVGPDYHPWRPCAIFLPALRNGDEVVLVDLRTGERLFGWHSKDWQGEDLYCVFFVGDDRVGICIRNRRSARPNFAPADYRVELYRIAGGELLHTFTGLQVGENRTTARTGRVAWDWKNEKPRPIDVFDFNVARNVFATPPPDRRPNPDFAEPDRGGPLLNEDGTRLLHLTNQTLWDLGRAQPLWRARPGESIVAPQGTESTERFQTAEQWTLDLGRWSKSLSTSAIRDLRTGAVLYRRSDSLPPQARFSTNGRLYFDGEYVFATPPPPNYTLLTLCQSILALPLILLWALLRWRRRRAARRQPAEATP